MKETGLIDLDNLGIVDLRFRIENLGQLKNPKGIAKNDKLITAVVGVTVLVFHDNGKRFSWPLAKIVEVYPSEDGSVRVVKAKTENGLPFRLVQRLV